MRKPRILTAALLALCVCSLASAQEKRTMTVEDLYAIEQVGSPVLSPDGRWIAFTLTRTDVEANRGYTDIWLVSTDGAELRRLTTHSGGEGQPAWSPDSKTLAFVCGRSGAAQVWLIAIDGGEARRLTNIRTGAGGPKFSPDGTQMLVSSLVFPGLCDEASARKLAELRESPVQAKVIDSLLYRHWNTWRDDGRRSHLFLVDVATGAHRDLMKDADYDVPPFPFGGRGDYDFSPDGSEIAFAAKTDPNPAWHTNIDIFTLPLAAPAEGAEPPTPTCITEDLDGEDTHPVYSPDGKYIAFGSRLRPGFEADQVEIHLHDRATGDRTNITGQFDRSVAEFGWAPDSRALYCTAPHLGRRPIFRVPVGGGEAAQVVGGGYITNLNIGGDWLVYGKRCLRFPLEIFRVSTDGQNEQQLTSFSDKVLGQLELATVEESWFSGAGGDQVHMFIVLPPGFDSSKRWPLFQLIHGGPQQDYADLWTFGWNSQLFAAQGYVVALVCFHATPGYGQDFVDAVSRDWGGAPFEDIMKGTDHMIAQGYVDPERLAAGGGSFGGYLTSWIGSQTDRFAALITHAGGFNLESKYGATEELWFPEWELGGPYWENREDYEKFSPHRFVQNWVTPTLIMHGQLDFRVPVGQAFELFTALQRRGIESRFVYFPDEDHWILGPQNKILWYRQFIEWLDKYVGGGPR